jgi:hypothetical protein
MQTYIMMPQCGVSGSKGQELQRQRQEGIDLEQTAADPYADIFLTFGWVKVAARQVSTEEPEEATRRI